MDIDILVKTQSEGNHCLYRKIDLQMLGAISSIKHFSKEENKEDTSEDDDKEGFSKIKSTQRTNFIDKKLIFQNLKSYLDGFSSV